MVVMNFISESKIRDRCFITWRRSLQHWHNSRASVMNVPLPFQSRRFVSYYFFSFLSHAEFYCNQVTGIHSPSITKYQISSQLDRLGPAASIIFHSHLSHDVVPLPLCKLKWRCNWLGSHGECSGGFQKVAFWTVVALNQNTQRCCYKCLSQLSPKTMATEGTKKSVMCNNNNNNGINLLANNGRSKWQARVQNCRSRKSQTGRGIKKNPYPTQNTTSHI